jgi:hypothetical protein
LLSEAEELAELDELGEAVEQYQGAVLTQPSWPKSAEDESPKQSEVRETLSLKLNARLTELIAQGAWAEACQLSITRQRLERFTDSSKDSSKDSTQERRAHHGEVLKALWRTWEERLSDVTRWGELTPLLEQARGACGVKETDPNYQEALGQLNLVVSLSVYQALERIEALSEPPLSPLTHPPLDHILGELDRRWRALRPLTPSLTPQRLEGWEGLMEQARRPLWRLALDEAKRKGQHGLSWLLSVLLERLDHAHLNAHVSLTHPLISLSIATSEPSADAPELTPLIERAKEWNALGAQLLPLSSKEPQAPHSEGVEAYSVTLIEHSPPCERSAEEIAEEVRLIDHYEERPTPRWREATLEIEETQARFEALKANLEHLTERLASEGDPIVRARLEAEVERSTPEVAREKTRLEEAERALKGLTPTFKEPVYVLFRYPATRWSMSCEVTWSLTLTSPQSTSQDTLTHTTHSEDITHKAYPQQRVKADPLSFPKSPQALLEESRAQLSTQTYAWLESRVFELRAERYRRTQLSTGEHLSLEQLDTLARLALTAPNTQRAESLSRVLFEALIAHPLFGELTLTHAPLLLGDLRRYHRLLPHKPPPHSPPPHSPPPQELP